MCVCVVRCVCVCVCVCVHMRACLPLCTAAANNAIKNYPMQVLLKANEKMKLEDEFKQVQEVIKKVRISQNAIQQTLRRLEDFLTTTKDVE